MTLKGSQRGGARQLAIHLMRTDENDFVELHEVRGFISDDLGGALREAYAVSKGTRCDQFLFSLSLSPPETAAVSVSTFEDAIEDIEAKLGLTGQPRVVVFHEKNGRRHAHCVWSRIDADAMKAINLPHFKLKLRDVSRELYLEHGWRMPSGLVNSAERDPRNFSREEWQQAKRAERDPRDLKELFQDCWAVSDSGKAFAQALESRGLYLARGDRRGFVALDIKGEVYSISRWTGIRTKLIEARLGNPDDLRSVEETKLYIVGLLKGMLGRQLAEAEQTHRARLAPVLERKTRLRAAQRHERADLAAKQQTRADVEAKERASRFRAGFRGLWDRLTGRYRQIRRENEASAFAAMERDDRERQSLIQVQLRQRQLVQSELREIGRAGDVDLNAIHRDLSAFGDPGQWPVKPDEKAERQRIRRKRDTGPTVG